MTRIPFNRPFSVGKEVEYIQQAIDGGHLSGDGPFTKKCHNWLEERIGCNAALLTHSCTAALEMTALLADIQPGDEVIMPSFTFVSTANAFVLRGGVPVFVDIRSDTLNIDENLIESAITGRTKAVVPVHYAGVGCEMDTISDIANDHDIMVIADAAQGLLSEYKGRPLGSIGHMATISFHETKNVISGEGGALLLNHEQWVERAEIIREKGTNRSQFFRGQVDKYSWVDLGSSYLPSEINAAFLWAQLEQVDAITKQRLNIWTRYNEGFADLEKQGKVRRPVVPDGCLHNAHMYYLLLGDLKHRTRIIRELDAADVHAVFHYVPLHSSIAGRKYGRVYGDLTHTQELSDRLVRLPLWVKMCEDEINHVIETINQIA
jgi:dTDP-4-amino-4,6-dideoxygalactose transaminase